MSKINRIIPFGLWPSNWGLSGERLARARAEYYLDGEDLAYRLLEIEYPELSDREYDWAREYRTSKLKLDYRYHKVGEYDYGLGLIENDVRLSDTSRARELAKYMNRFGRLSSEDLEYKLLELSYDVPGTEEYQRELLKLDVRHGKKTQEQAERDLLALQMTDHTTDDYKKAVLLLDHKFGKISQNELDKQTATINKEPWFNFMGADKKIKGDNVQAAVELDWNEYFVEFLESKGWTGNTPDEIVDLWFEDAMKQMLDIYTDEELDDGSQDPMPMAGAGRVKRDDGLTEYR